MIKQAVILAAGKGSRMKKGATDPILLNTPKPLLQVNGVPIIERIIKKLVDNGIDVAVVVHPDNREKFEEKLSAYSSHITYCLQEDRTGTASALYAAKDFVTEDLFLVFMGDDITDYDISNIKQLDKPYVFGYNIEDVTGYGALVLGEGDEVVDVIEKKLTGPGVVNTGVYIMPKQFFAIYKDIPVDEKSGEYFLPYAVKLLRDSGIKFYLMTVDFWFGINTPEQLLNANRGLKSDNG